MQFDLIKQDCKNRIHLICIVPEFKSNKHSRSSLKFQEATCVKEVFQWDDGCHESFKKMKMKEL